MVWWWNLLVLLFVCVDFCAGDAETHEYKKEEKVVVWENKVGPYNNPQETYTYNSLPFCESAELNKKPEAHALGIGEILEGNQLVDSGLHLSFAKDTHPSTLCSQILTQKEVDAFTFAVDNHYWYQMNVDDLPVWGLVGKIVSADDKQGTLKKFEAGTHLLYTHKKFSISYNGPNIIHVNLTYSNAVSELKADKHVEFTYEVKWSKTNIKYEDRFDRYLEDEFFEHQIHWFSIFNSFMMVIFLCGLVALILLRTLKNDYARFTQIDLDEMEMMQPTSSSSMSEPHHKINLGSMGGDDSTGWKQVHGDVFRPPEMLSLYCAMIGTGAQLIVLVVLVLLISIVSSLYVKPGGIVSVGLICYAISSFVSGYVSGGMYYQFFYPNVSKDWIKTMICCVSLLPGILFSMIFMMNFVAISYGTTYAIPFLTFLQIILLWAFVSFPLAILGTILGRHWSGHGNFPCRVNRLPRSIPIVQWYFRPRVLILCTGVLPFGSIFIEMYFVFTSFWNYKFYYVYGFLLLVFIILTIVSICVTIVTTYFLLNSENYKWHWTSFLASGSTALYVFGYAIYFYFFKTKMSGLLQTCFYFGYMSLFCLAFFIMCGTLGFIGSNIFTKRIYRNIKSE